MFISDDDAIRTLLHFIRRLFMRREVSPPHPPEIRTSHTDGSCMGRAACPYHLRIATHTVPGSNSHRAGRVGVCRWCDVFRIQSAL